MNNLKIVRKHKDLIKYVDFLQKKNAENLSFYPKQVFERESEKGRIFLALLNNFPCGYLYCGSLKGNAKLHQVCIQYDARRRLFGAELVGFFEQICIESGTLSISLRCGFDLDANSFWQELGYTFILVSDGGVRRGRKINTWKKYLQPTLFNVSGVNPSRGKTDSSFWRKNKKTGIINQFSRGSTLGQYKNLISGDEKTN